MSRQKQTAFTIVELLIVIVVIAILAAITVVAYNGIQNRSRATAVQSDFSSIKKKLLLYKADVGRYPRHTGELTTADIRATKEVYETDNHNNFYYCTNVDSDEFSLRARTLNRVNYFKISSTGSLEEVGNADANATCQDVGLTGYADDDARSIVGHSWEYGWQDWVKG